MKLSLLFAKFLYQHKHLNLPGIGAFSFDPAVTIPEITDKNSQEILQHVRFVQKTIAKPDEEFIEFIRTHTGKIRPLAESDLESFISEGKILLNIGKPFHLEGVGTLQKSRAGTFEFYPGIPLLEKLENVFPEKDSKSSNPKQGYEQDYNPAAKNNQSGRTIWIVLAILIGVTAVIWGGYTLYNSNTDNEGGEAVTSVNVDPDRAPADSIQNRIIDSTTNVTDSAQPVNTAISSTKPFKFIFRLGSKSYVMNRYNELKGSNPGLNWDTRDSVLYRLYLSIPAAASDTARLRDSLKEWYGSKKVSIEQ